jgi:hypothetical protein
MKKKKKEIFSMWQSTHLAHPTGGQVHLAFSSKRGRVHLASLLGQGVFGI